MSAKRSDVLTWEDYFMAMAFLSSQRSKDPVTQVGACIVNEDKRIVGMGYNGFPNDCSDDVLPWTKGEPKLYKNKHLYVCHAEMNAIANKFSADVKNCIIYVSLFPCNECAKLIIQAGIKTVVYVSDKNWAKETTMAAREMFKLANILCRKYEPSRMRIEIDFGSIDR